MERMLTCDRKRYILMICRLVEIAPFSPAVFLLSRIRCFQLLVAQKHELRNGNGRFGAEICQVECFCKWIRFCVELKWRLGWRNWLFLTWSKAWKRT
jgi:hypothetical protein